MDKAAISAMLQARLTGVERRLAAACARAGRTRGDVTVIAVTKTVSAEIAALLPPLGLVDLAENRPQELWRKAAVLPTSIRWHLIGHLQRNKIEQSLPLVKMIHSVDSDRLLQALEAEAGSQNRSVDVLLEVNASGEATKQGFAADKLMDAAPSFGSLQQVRIRGLMTMAPLQTPEACRSIFVALRGLRDRLARQLAAPHELAHLSMGMSNDFEVAVEEGATMVRLGGVIFEGLTA